MYVFGYVHFQSKRRMACICTNALDWKAMQHLENAVNEYITEKAEATIA